MSATLVAIQETVRRIGAARFPDADSIFLCGSVVRGEGTATSDLDLVVLFPHVEAAWRESFTFESWPVECFCHDLETAEYYFTELDRPSGVGALTHMVLDGIAVPNETELAQRLRARAQANYNVGPPALTQTELDYSRYSISGLMDDLRGATTHPETIAIATVLYHLLGFHILRTRNRWAGHGKTIPRRLQRMDGMLATRFEAAFSSVFSTGNAQALLDLCAHVIEPQGGYLFDGYHPISDPAHRKALPLE